LSRALRTLPLLPLRAVLFPGGVLHLTATAPPAVALLQQAHQSDCVFGVSLWQADANGQHVPAAIGVVARVQSLHATAQAVRVVCVGRHRFRALGQAFANAQGQWQVNAITLDDDVHAVPAATMLPTVQALARAIAAMQAAGKDHIRAPFQLDDAGWVANRWCELLPLALQAKQQLMALTDPQARRALVDRYLRDQRIVS
jgi:uncharacterized protein